MFNIGEPVYRACVMTWSEDQKIAITSSRIVHVCQLKSALHTSEISSKTEPFTEITVALLPDNLDPIDVGVTFSEAEAKDEIEQPIMKKYCSQKHRPTAQNTFKLSRWTPTGCSLHGGCLLTCLTNGDHVILFAPPLNFGYQWRKLKVLSEALHDYWKSHCYGNSNSQSSSQNDFHELDRRRRLLSITSFLWLPGVVSNHKHSTVVMVITTEANHVVFVRCVFDLLKGDINCTVDHMIQLPAKSYGWGCKLACMQHQDDIFLSIGCSNGDVYLLIMGGAAKSFAYTDSQLHPIIDNNDNIPIVEMTWEKITKPSADHCVLVVAKNQIMVVVQVPLMGGGISMQGVVQGHIFPTSGLASLPGGRFISCSRDKSILEFFSPDHQPDSVDAMATSIKAKPIDIPITGEPIGMAASHNGLFIAVVEMIIASRPFLNAQCKVHFIKLATQPSELIGYFENMVAMETPLYLCWDVFELLRQFFHADNTLDINTLLPPEVLNGMNEGNKYCLQLAKILTMTLASCNHENATVNNLDMETLDCSSTRNHVCEYLMQWLREPDQHATTRDMDIINNMMEWLSAFGSPTDKTLRKDVEAKLKSMSGSQSCPMCGAVLNWITYNTLECLNQHKWNSCHVTCTVLGRYGGRRCTQCGAYTTKGLQELTLLPNYAYNICFRCGGLLQIL